jgi:transcriptional regulator with XRE-family HTH domain
VAVTFLEKKPERMTTNWGLEIKRIRKSQGLSQRGLARLAQVHRSSLRRLEANKGEPPISLVEHLADTLGYELDMFFRGFDRAGLPA